MKTFKHIENVNQREMACPTCGHRAILQGAKGTSAYDYFACLTCGTGIYFYKSMFHPDPYYIEERE